MSLNNGPKTSASQLTAQQTEPRQRPESGPSGPERRPGHRPEYPPGNGREYNRPYRPSRPYYPYDPYNPPVAVCPAGASPYNIQPGDTLYDISNRYGLSVDEIVATNPYIDFSFPLQVGQLICLPFG